MHRTTRAWAEQMYEAYLNGWIHAQTFPLTKPYVNTQFRRTSFRVWIEDHFDDVRITDTELDNMFEKIIKKINEYKS